MPSKEDAASGIVFRNFRLIEELSPRHNVALSAAGGRPELVLAGLLVLLGGVVALVPALLIHRRPVIVALRA